MTAERESDQKLRKITEVEQWKVRQFFRKLKSQPFVAVTVGPDKQPEIFLTTDDPEDLRIIREAIHDLDI